MCQTNFISSISSPAINSNFISVLVKRSDDFILRFQAKMLTQNEAEIVRKLLINIEEFRTCDCSKDDRFCEKHDSSSK